MCMLSVLPFKPLPASVQVKIILVASTVITAFWLLEASYIISIPLVLLLVVPILTTLGEETEEFAPLLKNPKLQISAVTPPEAGLKRTFIFTLAGALFKP